MSDSKKERISFDVETERVLQILSSEIYDSPKAFLRENVQNAYDAILMRCTAEDISIDDRKIEIILNDNKLSIQDDGIGMTENVLKENFWRAGSSGKKTELAQRSGVIGTFGIGAMANFGVCTRLQVETRHIESQVTLISSARREDLRIAQNCIDLERAEDTRGPGTLVNAELDPAFSISVNEASEYLKQYVQFLPVPVLINGTLISKVLFEDTLGNKAQGFNEITKRQFINGEFSGSLRIYINNQARVLVRVNELSFNNTPLQGEMFFVQGEGQTLGFRNLFGLAPIPLSGVYNFGGFVNLNILHPTAGREALSRESIQLVTNLINILESEVSNDIAETDYSDQNQQFQQYILSHNLIQLAKKVNVTVLPGNNRQIPLEKVKDFEPEKSKLYYPGQDSTVQQKFSGENSNLFQVSQTNPRRKLQLRYLQKISVIQEVPDQVIVDQIPQTSLSVEEAMFLVRVRGVLLDDYFMPDVDAHFAIISHGVSIHFENQGESLKFAISRDMQAARMVIESYRSAPEVFHGFVIDFVRQQIYPQIRDRVPSSTRQGRDALYRRLKENEELFRYDVSDLGKAELLLADFLSGKADLNEVIKSSAGQGSGQRQEVRREQVGTVEEELPDILASGDDVPPSDAYQPSPPILRTELTSDMKLLTVGEAHSRLNGFQMFVSLSDRLARREGEFLRQPHTTKLMWGSHRIIYIFSDSTGELNLYYDLKLKEALGTETTGGSMFPTTTIITKDRIFVPVPKEIEAAFQIADSDGVKEFYVRFDTIP